MIAPRVTRLVGQSRWLRKTQLQIEHIAPFRANVLISGPSGTGKELVARAIHHLGPRAQGPFLPVNCAAIPHALFDSQMFGHAKGAFTGAEYESLGCFRAAEGGTLFLDEVGELDLDLQAKLLRVLQDRQVVPVGEQRARDIDVRIVAATNRDLEREIAAGRFRLDLYYRLNVIEIPTLALRERPDDIEPLSRHLLHKACVENGLPAKHISDAACSRLMNYDWPGNVRELQNLMERAALASEDEVLGARLLESVCHRLAQTPSEVGTQRSSASEAEPVAANSSGPPPEATPWKTLEEVEAAHIARTLRRVDSNKSAAARLLSIDRKRLDRKIQKYCLLEVDAQAG